MTDVPATPAPPRKSPALNRATLVILATVATLEAVYLAWKGGPALARSFMTAGAALPKFALMTLRVSDALRQYWFVPLGLWLLFSLAACAGLFDRVFRAMAILLVTVILLLALIYGLGIGLPLSQLTEAVRTR